MRIEKKNRERKREVSCRMDNYMEVVDGGRW